MKKGERGGRLDLRYWGDIGGGELTGKNLRRLPLYTWLPDKGKARRLSALIPATMVPPVGERGGEGGLLNTSM